MLPIDVGPPFFFAGPFRSCFVSKLFHGLGFKLANQSATVVEVFGIWESDILKLLGLVVVITATTTTTTTTTTSSYY